MPSCSGSRFSRLCLAALRVEDDALRWVQGERSRLCAISNIGSGMYDARFGPCDLSSGIGVGGERLLDVCALPELKVLHTIFG